MNERFYILLSKSMKELRKLKTEWKNKFITVESSQRICNPKSKSNQNNILHITKCYIERMWPRTKLNTFVVIYGKYTMFSNLIHNGNAMNELKESWILAEWLWWKKFRCRGCTKKNKQTFCLVQSNVFNWKTK